MKMLNLLLSLLALTSGCQTFSHQSQRSIADQLSKEKKYDEAVQAYWNHINDRLAVKNRPSWENPYLYLLDIGDLYLEQDNIEEALKYYELAEEKGVKQGYVNDRYRSVATWYEERGRMKEALALLKRYESKDPFMFGMMEDRLAKELVRQEDSAPRKQKD